MHEVSSISQETKFPDSGDANCQLQEMGKIKKPPVDEDVGRQDSIDGQS